jgi:hypothetical protein
MRTIDERGRRVAVTRRGSFDFVRLLSLSPLGVPFAATTALAQRIGGFSADDVADDVRFCIEAWAHARFVHVGAPLIDYRVHGGSRTEAVGGEMPMHRAFLATIAHVRPALERAGLRPLDALAAAVLQRLDDLDLAVEHWSYARRVDEDRRWWCGAPRLDALFQAGLMPVQRRWRAALVGLAPPLAVALRSLSSAGGPTLRAAWATRRLRKALSGALLPLAEVLLPWAYLRLGLQGRADGPALRLASADARTLVGASMLHATLGCPLRADSRLRAPAWLALPPAEGDEPMLDLSATPALETGAAS